MKKDSMLTNYGLIAAVITHGPNGNLLNLPLTLSLVNRVATLTN